MRHSAVGHITHATSVAKVVEEGWRPPCSQRPLRRAATAPVACQGCQQHCTGALSGSLDTGTVGQRGVDLKQTLGITSLVCATLII